MNDLEVLLVAFHYPPEISGGIPRALITEDFLVRAGCRVRILTPQMIDRGCRGGEIVCVPLPGCLKPRAADRATQASKRSSPLRNFVRRWLLLPDPFGLWAVPAARRAIEAARSRRVDLVITSSPPESVHWIGRCLKRRFGCTWVADFRDGWTFEPHRPEAALPGRRLLERRLERSVVEGADWITAATRPLAEDLAARYPRRHRRIQFLPTAFQRLQSTAAPRRDGMFRLTYTGRLGLSRYDETPSVFFAAVKRAIESNREFPERFRLVLVGAFTEKDRGMWRDGPVATCVEELGPRPYGEALKLAAEATMLLLLTPAGQRSVATRKLFDYLAVRRPVFALAASNEAARILQETRAGVCVPPDDAEAVARGLLHVYALWRAGTLDREVPCSENDLYEAEPHFARVIGREVLPAAFQRRQIGLGKPDIVEQSRM